MSDRPPSHAPSRGPDGLSLAAAFEALPGPVRGLLRAFKVDPRARHASPSGIRWVAALIVANAGSLISDAVLVALGKWVFPSTQNFPHFQFSDYAKLTIVGVTVACIAWPVVTWIASQPRWLFLRLAVLVTLVLWLPDLWILAHREPIRGVGVLMLMHLAIALVTYPALIRLAPEGPVVSRREP